MRFILAGTLLAAIAVWGTGCNEQADGPAEPAPPADPGLEPGTPEPGTPGTPGASETDAYPPQGQSGQLMPRTGEPASVQSGAGIGLPSQDIPSQNDRLLEGSGDASPGLSHEESQLEIDASLLETGDPPEALGERYGDLSAEIPEDAVDGGADADPDPLRLQ